MAMGEQEEICTLCKEKVVYGRDGQVMCWFIDQPDKKRECPAGRQLVDAALPPPDIPEPSPPPNPFIQPEPPQPSLSSPVMPLERRGRRLLLSLMILLLLISSGLLAFYSFQSHSQILSLDAKNSTQAAIIQNQGTVIQRGQAALTETVQTVIRQEQATQTALGRQLGNLQATSTTIAKNTQLEAFFVKQSPYPTISVTQSVPISFTFMNAGTLPWSNQGGFILKCTSLTRTGPLPNSAMKPVCPNPGTITIDNASSVTIGKQYTFSFKFSPSALSLSGGGNVYATFWQLDYKGTLFGPEVYVQVTVN